MTEHDTIPPETLVAYRDGELPASEARRVRAALEHDAAARQTLADWARQDEALAALYGPAAEAEVPGRLSAVVSGARSAPQPAGTWRRAAAAVALVILGAAGGYGVAQLGSPGPGGDGGMLLADRAMNAHRTFAVEVRHPVEVEAEQAAHLTGWVAKRLGHRIDPPEFAAHGFHLIGGRVLPGRAGPEALFMYENETGRRVTLYVAMPEQDGQTAFQFAGGDGAQSFYWVDNGLSYAVVGNIGREDLRRIALDAYDQLI